MKRLFFCKDESGAGAIEAAFLIPAFVLCIIAVVNFGYYFSCGYQVNIASSAVARAISDDPTIIGNDAALRSSVLSECPSLGDGDNELRIEVSPLGTSNETYTHRFLTDSGFEGRTSHSSVDSYRITVSYTTDWPFSVTNGIFGGDDISIASSSQVGVDRIEGGSW